MSRKDVVLKPLRENDREQFVKDNQWAFKYGSLEEFGLRNDQFEENDEIISRKTIEDCIDKGDAYRIVCGEEIVGGVVVHTEESRGELDLLFTKPEVHSKGFGYAAWCEVEKRYPDIKVWETFTPYFETRNIHFYVNKCGFHIVEFYNPMHNLSEDAGCGDELDFRFEKVMNDSSY